jgi:hypothetical protein
MPGDVENPEPRDAVAPVANVGAPPGSPSPRPSPASLDNLRLTALEESLNALRQDNIRLTALLETLLSNRVNDTPRGVAIDTPRGVAPSSFIQPGYLSPPQPQSVASFEFASEGLPEEYEEVSRPTDKHMRRASVGGPHQQVFIPKDMRFPKPEYLDGTNNKLVRGWFQTMRQYLQFHNMDLDNPSVIFIVSGHLKGYAADWFSLCKLRNGNDPFGGFKTFAEMEEAALLQFREQDPEKKARHAIKHAKQTSTVVEYVKFFRRQIIYLPLRHEADNVADFISGLKYDIKTQVTIANPATLEKAMELALNTANLLASVRDKHDSKGGRLANMYENLDSDDSGAMSECDGDTCDLDPDYEECANVYTKSRKGGKFPKKNPPKATGGLSEEARSKLMRDGKCFYCKEPGHISLNCPKKKKGKGGGEE